MDTTASEREERATLLTLRINLVGRRFLTGSKPRVPPRDGTAVTLVLGSEDSEGAQGYGSTQKQGKVCVVVGWVATRPV
jgi:hypothetical protein